MNVPFDPETAAKTLLAARAGGTRPAGLPVPPPDVAAAYAVQTAVMRRLGQRSNWKMALLGGRDRQAAAMPAGETVRSGITLSHLPADAAIEVETALILGRDLPSGSGPDEALAAIGEVRLAFEFVGSRFADRTAVAPLEAMADSFSSAAVVLGDTIPNWREALNGPLDLSLFLDAQIVAAEEQSFALAETTDFVSWLSSHAAEQNLPLSSGTVIITGARIGPIPLRGSRHAVAHVAERRAVEAFLHFG